MEKIQIRETWAEVNLNHIGYNIIQMKKKLPRETEIMAVVKANGYGHGSVEVAKQALESGATALAVALLEEALHLRQAGIEAPILVLGRVQATFAPLAAEHDITLTFFQKSWLEELHSYSWSRPLKLHMKWDTGMGRIGVREEEEFIDIISTLKESTNISLTGVYTHFSTADEKNPDFYYQQIHRFENMLARFRELWKDPVSVHLGNSAASIRCPEDMHHYIRFGISMYGLYPSEFIQSEEKISLQPAFSLHSQLTHVKQIQAGEPVGYGKTYHAETSEWIGTIPIGYGDGWPRRLQGFHVLIDGKLMPIVGRVCMDMMMVKLDREYCVGTKVTLIGKQQDAEISMEDVADYLGTINYEIPCMINERVPRVYVP